MCDNPEMCIEVMPRDVARHAVKAAVRPAEFRCYSRPETQAALDEGAWLVSIGAWVLPLRLDAPPC